MLCGLVRVRPVSPRRVDHIARTGQLTQIKQTNWYHYWLTNFFYCLSPLKQKVASIVKPPKIESCDNSNWPRAERACWLYSYLNSDLIVNTSNNDHPALAKSVINTKPRTLFIVPVGTCTQTYRRHLGLTATNKGDYRRTWFPEWTQCVIVMMDVPHRTECVPTWIHRTNKQTTYISILLARDMTRASLEHRWAWEPWTGQQ